MCSEFSSSYCTFVFTVERVQWNEVEEELGRVLGVSNPQTDLTFDRATPMESSLNQFLKDANEMLDSKKGVKKIKDGRQSGKSFRGRYQNSWRGRPYAR